MVNFKDIDGNHMYGFVIAARNHTHEFYSTSKEETREWVEALKEFVILLDLKDELVIRTLLGKGNSAKVHQCERKDNPKIKFALKTISKSYIKQNKNNQVSVSFSSLTINNDIGVNFKGD